ncbi:MAG: glycosyltransferase family 39 protein [Clostridiales bacterium]|nr:glycosyltransferase family 39 protein [Clostridiales bacterium]
MKLLFVSGASASDISIIVVATVFSVLCFIGLIVLLCRFADYGGKVKNTALIMAGILFAGLALRIVFALCVRGSRADYGVFVTMINSLKLSGPAGYYSGDASKVLYPIVYFVYLIFGGLANAMELSSHSLGMQFMIKLPLIIADLLTAFAVFKIADRYINRATALVLAGFVCICPIFFIGSAIWCSPITFTVMFACFACYYLARKNHVATIAFATLAAFSSKEGIYLFPVIFVFSVYHLVRAILNIKRDNIKGGAVLGADYRAVITVPVSFVLSFVVVYLLGLIMVHSHSYNPFTYIYEFLLAPLSGWTYFTSDGLSVYSIFNRSGATAGARFPSWLFVCLFAAIIFAVVGVVYFTKRNRATMVLLIAFSLLTMQVYYPDSTAVSMQGTLAVLLAAYALNRDKRILYVLFTVGLCFAVNSLTTLGNMGQMNNLSDYNLEATATGGIKAVTIACSVITVIAHLYFTVVTVSVGMTGQRRMLDTQRTIGGSLSEFFAVKKDK